MLNCNMQLVEALSIDPLCIAGILLAKGFISDDKFSEMQISSQTPKFKAVNLVAAVKSKIKISPSAFNGFLQILRELSWTKDIEIILWETYDKQHTKSNSTQQAALTSSTYDIMLCKQSTEPHHSRTRDIRKEDSISKYILLLVICTMTLVVILSAQSILVTSLTAIITLPSLLAIGDSIIHNRSILQTLREIWSMIMVIAGNTVGSFIPYKCPYCSVWSRISSYGGNVVQGYAECPNCHRDIFNPRN